jgi:phage gp36-like protein
VAYATVDLIAAEAKVSSGFSDNTNPTEDTVDAIIAQIEAKLDARISRKYSLPLVDANAILIMQGISIAFCVERVREIMEVRTGSPTVEQMAAKTSADYARRDLERIVSGELPLPNTTLASSYDGVKSNNLTTGQAPFFKVGCDQW